MTEYQKQTVANLIKAKNSSKKSLYLDLVLSGENIIADLILEAVAAMGEGYVVDICKKAIEARTFGKEYLSEKQAWCVVYAFVKISDEALIEWYENFCVEETVEEQNDAMYVVRTSSANNEMNLHSINKKEFSTNSLEEAVAMFKEEVKILREYYVTADAFDYSPSDAEYANAVVCEIVQVADGDIDVIESSDYFFEK
jgi:hypothetical protein